LIVKADPETIARLIRELQNISLEVPSAAGGKQPPEPPLPNDDGREYPNGMEARVAKLEAHMEHVRSELAKLAQMPTDLAVLRNRVDHLPSKSFIVTAVTGATGLIGAVVLFADRLRVLIGAG